MKDLLDLVYRPRSAWDDQVRTDFSNALRARYPRVADLTDKRNDEKRFQLRVNAELGENSVPYAALVPPDQELSGPYGGMSFVIFPADEDGRPALIAMVVGTNGLAPDEAVLGRPGHGRKCAAIASWLNAQNRAVFAWAKRDPVRIDMDVPAVVTQELSLWSNSLKRYGRVVYAVVAPPMERTHASDDSVSNALTVLMDLFFQERGIEPKAEFRKQSEEARRSWLSHALPSLSDKEVVDLLRGRRFVVIEGPPGTGKTEMARRLLKEGYDGHGELIQFHPSVTYESFIGGLAPIEGGAMGFSFQPTPGHLMQATLAARQHPNQRYLLVIDEINRADLAKVLGEAIFLLEPQHPDRSVQLQYEFRGIGKRLSLPANLDILGTMNSADRSIAILDVAVRRRFAFVPLWPQLSVVEKCAAPRLKAVFEQLLMVFVEYASDDALPLMPGHSYFLGTDDVAAQRLRTELRPLLEEYLAQGYVSGFGAEIQAFIDWISQRG